MAKKPRVVLNREALHELDLRVAMGIEGIAQEILDRVDVPDAEPFGRGLVEGGGWISYVDGKKVGASHASVQKPRDMRVRGKGIAVGVGFGFPGRFVETGTVDTAPQPFLTPVVLEVTGDEGAVVGAMRAAHADRLDRARRRIARTS